jgi:2'-5' RNA ligase
VPRVFLALTLDAGTRSAVGAAIERLRPLSRAVAWVPEPNLHLTLKFLGEQPAARLAEVSRAVGEAARGIAPFTLSLHGLGAFPGMERPRILWVGVAEGALAARELQGRMEAALAECGFARDQRPWHPHLTIGRVFDDRRWRREASPALREAVAEAARQSFGAVAVASVILMRSDLSPRGARYTELGSTPLGCPPAARDGPESG